MHWRRRLQQVMGRHVPNGMACSVQVGSLACMIAAVVEKVHNMSTTRRGRYAYVILSSSTDHQTALCSFLSFSCGLLRYSLSYITDGAILYGMAMAYA